ncbi:MAG: rhodanese-like domain-containing protein [Flavobacteriia bacterium]|nr:rhodanese-like domain-containing protein [Flavobacteriia bacterium]OJX35036.1 MAG: NADH oxidase [Flavobacteriia bacterium 40-80]
MKTINVSELKRKMDNGDDFQLIDVREPSEYDICNLKGELIPVNTIPENVELISRDKDVIIHCRSGVRSANAISYLEQHFGLDNLYNLEGGILAWITYIDPAMESY